MKTIPDIIVGPAADRPAIGAPDRSSLTYGGLDELARRTTAALNGCGIGRGNRVAIVLPNGPEMAAAFLSIGAGASAAPLNPAHKKDEFAFYLDDFGTSALVVEAGSQSPAVAAAGELGIPVLSIAWSASEPAGSFRFADTAPAGTAERSGPSQESDEGWSFTLRARPRDRRSCRSATAISPPPPITSARRWGSPRTMSGSTSCRFSTFTG